MSAFLKRSTSRPTFWNPPTAPDGDVLTQAALWELFQNEEALRRVDERGELHPPKLEDQPLFV